MTELDVTFESMGSQARLVVGGRSPADAVRSGRAFLEAFEARLSRFRPDSELCASTPRRWRRSSLGAPAPRGRGSTVGGLAAPAGSSIPTLLPASSRRPATTATAAPPSWTLAAALLAAPARAPARPHPAARWRAVVVDDARGVVRRPPGLRLDTGGIGQGARGRPRWPSGSQATTAGPSTAAATCGSAGARRHAALRGRGRAPAHPRAVRTLSLSEGAVATSGPRRPPVAQARRAPGPSPAGPGDGRARVDRCHRRDRPAPTTADAEARAKAALLSGPRGARRRLERHGGLIVRDDGDVEAYGPLRARPRSGWRHERAAAPGPPGLLAREPRRRRRGPGAGPTAVLPRAGQSRGPPAAPRPCGAASARCTSRLRSPASVPSRVHGLLLLGDPWLHPACAASRSPSPWVSAGVHRDRAACRLPGGAPRSLLLRPAAARRAALAAPAPPHRRRLRARARAHRRGGQRRRTPVAASASS